MPAGLVQLVAFGAQDAYLSSNPEITFWKSLFKRHTNFAIEPFRVNLTGQANWGVKHSAILGRHADLIYSTYLEVVLDPKYTDDTTASYNNDQGRLGYNLLKYIELDIGGHIVDKHYSEWMYLWDSLTSDSSKGRKLFDMVGLGKAAGSVSVTDASTCIQGSGRPVKPEVLYIPLYFFYTRNPGLALPLIALQYHEVKINIQWNDAKLVAGNYTVSSKLKAPISAALYVDYIYLDTEERRRMAQKSHEYLIEQVQFNEDVGISSAQNRIDLTFNHPVKELVWVVQPHEHRDCTVVQSPPTTRLEPFTYDEDAIFEQWIQLNGQDRLDRRYGDYFNKVQPYQHHTGVTAAYSTGGDSDYPRSKGVYMYSFALKPEEHQPSGTCNFSRIDTATIVMGFNGDVVISQDNDKIWDVRVYATNYNIGRIMNGMFGLAYSN
jgi:hypothetical protein